MSSSDRSVSPNTMDNAEAKATRANGAFHNKDSKVHIDTALPPWNGPASGTSVVSYSSDPFLSSNGSLRGAASSFQPAPDQLSRSLRILSLNSVDDNGPTIVTSSVAAKSPQEPIGTRGSGNNSPVRPKGCFSTDVNPEKPAVGGHFIMIQGLKPADIDSGIMSFIETEYNGEIRGKKVSEHEDEDAEVDMVLFIDDLRKSRKIVMDLDSVGSITVSHVSHDWYANGGKSVLAKGAQPKSMYVGQVTFVAEFKGRTADFKGDDDVWSKVKTFAEASGSVLAFDQNKAAPYPTWQFRAEFFKASDADKAIAAAIEPVKLGETKGWVISAKLYAPPNYGPVPSLPASSRPSTASSQTALIPHGATVYTSPTGRTSWYTDGEGNNHALPVAAPELGPDHALTETAVTPYCGNELVRYDDGPVATPRGYRGPPRMSGRSGPWSAEHGYYDVETSEFCQRDARGQLADVAIDRILNGFDVRTTVMLRNVPNDWNWQRIRALLDQVVPNRYNFMYLRIDFRVGKNVGYAFVNFENALDIVPVVQAFVGKPWDPARPQYHQGNLKTIQLSYATIQGIDSLIDKFRNSSVMDEMIDYRPLLLQTPEEFAKDEEEADRLAQRGFTTPATCPIGERKDFPAPNNRQKKERSTANAALLGLFTPRHRGHPGERPFRSQYDRGTPAQLMEDAHFNAMSPYGPPPFMIAPPMTNYTYGPPRGQHMFTPPLAPGMPPPFPGFMSAPAPGQPIMPRTPFMPDTPTRAFGGGRPGFNAFHRPVGFNGGPGQWIGPPAHTDNAFGPGFQGQSNVNGFASHLLMNGDGRTHSNN